MPAFLSFGLSKKKTLKKTGNPVFLSQLKQTRRKRSVCRKEGGFAPFLPPAFMRGEGHAVAGGVPPPQRRGKPPQSRLRRASSPRGRAKGASHRSCPPAFMRGEGHAVAGGVPRSGGKASSVTASPCQLPQRGSRGRCAPALPEGEPRGLRPVLAPRIYEGGGPRSGRGSLPAAAAGKASSVTASPCQLPQRGSRGRCAPALAKGKPRALRTVPVNSQWTPVPVSFCGAGLTGAVYSPPEMQVSVASGRGKWGQKGALWDVHNPAPENFAMFYTEKCIFRHRDRFLHLICFAI